MLGLFKKKCPVCKMELEKDKKYPERYGKKFCSTDCLLEYKKKIAGQQSHSSHGCH